MREKQNAIIEATALGPEGHGIFSAYLTLNYGGSGQAFGGYALDKHNGRRGTGSDAEEQANIRRTLDEILANTKDEPLGPNLP